MSYLDAKRRKLLIYFREFSAKTPKEKFEAAAINIAILVIFTLILFPILWIFGMAFKSVEDILVYPPKFFFTPTLDNFKTVLNIAGAGAGQTGAGSGILSVNFLSSYINSFVISMGALLVSVVVAIPAAYGIARYNFKGKEDLAFTILSFRFAPELLVIIPLFIIFQKIGLYDTYLGLIWVYQLITLPMIIWILRGDIEQVSKDLEDAYMLDGFKRIQAVIKIVLPVIRPGLVSSILLSFIFAWNNFLFGFVLASGKLEPATIAILKITGVEKVRYGEISAAAVLVCIPTLLFAIIARKHLVSGLSMGAVKK